MRKLNYFAAMLLTLVLVLGFLCGTTYGTGASADPEEQTQVETSPELMNIVASGTCGKKLTWTLDNKGVLTIKGTGAITLKGYYTWYDYTDAYDKVYKKIVLQPGVTSIEYAAFSGFKNLTAISLPDSLTEIADSAFSGCIRLTSVTIPDSVTFLGNDAFEGCSKLTSVKVPAHLTNIERAFLGTPWGEANAPRAGVTYDELNWSLDDSGKLTVSGEGELNDTPWLIYRNQITQVALQSGITAISCNAFSDYSKLTHISLPDTLTEIGDNAFYRCSSLKKIKIPRHVSDIGESVFTDCYKLTAINVDEENSIYRSSDGVLLGKGGKTVLVCPLKKKGSFQIPNGVTKIGERAFESSALTQVTFPDSVTTIGAHAFEWSSLTSVIMPKDLVSLGKGAFCDCRKLTCVYFRGDTGKWGSQVFEGCSILTNIFFAGNADVSLKPSQLDFEEDVPQNLYYPSGNASWRNMLTANQMRHTTLVPWTPDERILKPAKLSWKVDSAGTLTISGSGYMQDFDLLDDSENRDDDIPPEEWYDTARTNTPWFKYRKKIRKVQIQSGILSIGAHAFDGLQNVESVSIPKGVSLIGTSAFERCYRLKKVKLPAAVTSIGSRAFRNCQKLEQITIADRIAGVGAEAFARCYILKEVNLPDSVEYLGSEVLSSCDNITRFNIPKGVEILALDTFTNAYSLKQITVSSGNRAFCAKNGVLFSKDMKTLIRCPLDKRGTYTVPSGVKTLRERALFDCILSGIVLPKSVTTVENYVFEQYRGSVYYLGNAPAIGRQAYYNYGGYSYYPTNNKTWTNNKVKSTTDVTWVQMGKQTITAKSFTKKLSAGSFSLKAMTNGDGTLSYKSSKPKVATVSKKGIVKLKSVGKTSITITASKTKYFKAATKRITVTVKLR